MRTLLDTGPLVALFSKRDQHHTWAREHISGLGRPFYTCEAVLTEAYHLLSGVPLGVPRLHALLRRERLELSFAVQAHQPRIVELMETYANVPMSFADACLVRMAELHDSGRVFTTDGDFRIYRKNGDEPIDVLMP